MSRLQTMRHPVIRLPWRYHLHVNATVRIPETQWESLFDAVAEAAHALDEEIITSGSLRDPSWGICGVQIVGYGMRRRAKDALHQRVRAAIYAHQPPPAEVITTIRHRCRCS